MIRCKQTEEAADFLNCFYPPIDAESVSAKIGGSSLNIVLSASTPSSSGPGNPVANVPSVSPNR
jgi:hypothetical protein